MTRKQRIMITGANGFTGLHACQYFKKAGYDVTAVSRVFPMNLTDERIHMEQCDLTNKNQVKNLISKVKPEQLLHLAGQNNVQDSWNEPITSLEANAMSTAYIIDSIRQENLPCKIVIVGSALQLDLGMYSSFQHPYSLSKTIQVLVAQSWESLYGMDIVIAKPSNLIGPGDSTGVCSILAKKVAEMELHGSQRVLTVNNLFVQRDFIDVRDAVRAYEKLFEIGKSGVIYDITSGQLRSLKEITVALQNLSIVDFKIQTLKNTQENIEVTTSKKLLDAGWSPLISFEKSLEDILNYQRKSLL
ncbi:NAD-dependent epimerase/dehydratase family protein [Psychrobacillus glaciei]|uniref:NAD-dependent epimerase/dehydratase family protein n=1 Tax=Psychrobacillus glaciei TaxID=2283160 RepID=A0A5J6SRN4_9BACI|nr:NAD-dependent epimerase/dehydratase family protein [Psychrobacillus glaciei]QFG00672.1 NAD-dependent epimerase/dehydratase family protein [Psychrobacillus glaciei]